MPVNYVTQFGPESILYTKDEIIILMIINHTNTNNKRNTM